MHNSKKIRRAKKRSIRKHFRSPFIPRCDLEILLILTVILFIYNQNNTQRYGKNQNTSIKNKINIMKPNIISNKASKPLYENNNMQKHEIHKKTSNKKNDNIMKPNIVSNEIVNPNIVSNDMYESSSDENSIKAYDNHQDTSSNKDDNKIKSDTVLNETAEDTPPEKSPKILTNDDKNATNISNPSEINPNIVSNEIVIPNITSSDMYETPSSENCIKTYDKHQNASSKKDDNKIKSDTVSNETDEDTPPEKSPKILTNDVKNATNISNPSEINPNIVPNEIVNLNITSSDMYETPSSENSIKTYDNHQNTSSNKDDNKIKSHTVSNETDEDTPPEKSPKILTNDVKNATNISNPSEIKPNIVSNEIVIPCISRVVIYATPSGENSIKTYDNHQNTSSNKDDNKIKSDTVSNETDEDIPPEKSPEILTNDGKNATNISNPDKDTEKGFVTLKELARFKGFTNFSELAEIFGNFKEITKIQGVKELSDFKDILKPVKDITLMNSITSNEIVNSNIVSSDMYETPSSENSIKPYDNHQNTSSNKDDNKIKSDTVANETDEDTPPEKSPKIITNDGKNRTNISNPDKDTEKGFVTLKELARFKGFTSLSELKEILVNYKELTKIQGVKELSDFKDILKPVKDITLMDPITEKPPK